MAYFACAPGWTWSENWHSFRSGDGVGASADFSHLGEKKIDECWTDVVCSKKKKKKLDWRSFRSGGGVGASADFYHLEENVFLCL